MRTHVHTHVCIYIYIIFIYFLYMVSRRSTFPLYVFSYRGSFPQTNGVNNGKVSNFYYSLLYTMSKLYFLLSCLHVFSTKFS